MRHLVSIKDLTDDEFKHLVDKAEHLKTIFKSKDNSAFEEQHKKLIGRTVALLFSKRSTRTRISTEGASAFFGATPMFLGKDDIQLGVNESFKDTVKVVSSMVSCIFARVNKHSDIQQLVQHSSVPIVNSLCDKFHPLQAICDMLTIKEHFDYTNKKLKMAWVGDSNNVINDMAIAALKLGMDVAIATPSGIEMDKDIKEAAYEICARYNNHLLFTHDPVEAVKGANIVVTDTFVSMGEEYMHKSKVKQFQGYQVNAQLCEHAAPDYKFMHCLPRHQEEVSDEVFYGDHSIVFEQAENRLYAAIAVIETLVINGGEFTWN
ncbi:HBR434Cp [Eremothecium sinecaudum]|uniref:ornithine carbamoyltransferase n=1 Tax=Eremothecium sinecaudum TaxID=45286 RepID=A0A120K1F7_9SACH|nr:HBR434Cp [Eremothecium sinecaudum]AMD19335.1 HBR434Cp [Eremothecium sinecaudum]